jgi:hypothetical protein
MIKDRFGHVTLAFNRVVALLSSLFFCNLVSSNTTILQMPLLDAHFVEAVTGGEGYFRPLVDKCIQLLEGVIIWKIPLSTISHTVITTTISSSSVRIPVYPIPTPTRTLPSSHLGHCG